MIKSRWIIAFSIVAVLIGGCDNTQGIFMPSKNSPDEFAVYSRAPLSLPPNYALRPPDPGAVRPQDTAPRREAKKAILGGRGGADNLRGEAATPGTSAKFAGGSPGVMALLRDAGGLDADPDIRAAINQETSMFTDQGAQFANKLLFWRKQKEKGVALDPDAEARRIRKAKAMGRPVTEHTPAAPTIQRSKGRKPNNKSFWDRFFR
ncbi:MAG: DUF3035 domain-containing protein [Rhodospirillales bacterium]|jgi:hypothetical protein|nr:DUF3035 domain-containing protein [Rhodospirillales bacterium]HJN23066.1 DUF3035 domain-containing protein [Rhodospirillales bacterium]|tara:strand:- start:101 stop:718 length:618 start_codon:yes stop_codon:yes gene_type:complete